jgi:hypothetical protein
LADTDERVGFSRVRHAQIGRIRTVAKLLDTVVRIPGTNIRFGLDSVLGLVPGLGDAAGAIFSGYLVLVASRLGLPRHVIGRMVANVAVDSIVGGIPVLGDLFDVFWKSNMRNLELIETHTGANARTGESTPITKPVLIGALLVLLLLVAGGIWLSIVVIKALVAAAT